MRKAVLRLLFLVVLSVSSVVAIAAYNHYVIENCGHVASPFNDIIAEMISKINETEIYSTVYRLQNFTTRVYGHAGNTNAADYIYHKLENMSELAVEYQGSYKNVIATLPGTDPASNQIYVVGAHYDSTSTDRNDAPGATDNGGGVAIVLELARIMNEYQFKHTLKFAFWNYEERGAVGSSQFVKNASQYSLNIALYINYDSSCHDPNNRLVLDIIHNDQSRWVSELMTQHNTIYNIDFTLTHNAHTSISDHTPFWQSGYTAVMTQAETQGFAHTTSDTVDQVSTLYAKKNGQLGLSILAQLAGLER